MQNDNNKFEYSKVKRLIRFTFLFGEIILSDILPDKLEQRAQKMKI